MRDKENIATKSISQSYKVNSAVVHRSLIAIYRSLRRRNLGEQLHMHLIHAFLGSDQIKKINIYFSLKYICDQFWSMKNSVKEDSLSSLVVKEVLEVKIQVQDAALEGAPEWLNPALREYSHSLFMILKAMSL